LIDYLDVSNTDHSKCKWWRFGSVSNVVGRINGVNQRRARSVLGWTTVCRRVNYLGM